MDRLKAVLVVEDNPRDAGMLQHAAEKAPSGLAFHFVPSGEEAIAYLKGAGEFANRHAHPLPDLVLLDLWLPGISGFEVLSWIRHNPLLNELKVFVWTDAGEPESLERATQAGANTFVPKSIVFVRGGLAGLMGDIVQSLNGEAGAGKASAGQQFSSHL
jgi:CheY-like chemotaxis protein